MAEKNTFDNALKQAMAECSHRELCRSDIYPKLQSWGMGKEDSDRIVELLEKEKFINESRYASAFVNDKFRQNKWGKVKIAYHLRAKGIPGNIISEALDNLDNDLYAKTLRDLLVSHRRTVKAKNRYDMRSKLLRFGLSRGFENSLLYDILDTIEGADD